MNGKIGARWLILMTTQTFLPTDWLAQMIGGHLVSNHIFGNGLAMM